jgi:xylan 1,4-beta-xylosidase
MMWPANAPIVLTLKFKNLHARTAQVARVDGSHGDLRGAYEKMGSPRNPTQAQIRALREAAALPAAESVAIENDRLTLMLPPQGLAVIEIK